MKDRLTFEETTDFLFVHGAHFGGRDGDFVPVFVAAFRGEGVYTGHGRAVLVGEAEGVEVGLGDWGPGVVGEALVALGCWAGWVSFGG